MRRRGNEPRSATLAAVTVPPPPDPSQPSQPSPIRSLADWFFRNRTTGEITIAQAPNPPLAVLLVTLGLRLVTPDDSGAESALGWIGLAALAWWALDEVIRGVNPWRRVLGLVGCALVVAGAASRLS